MTAPPTAREERNVPFRLLVEGSLDLVCELNEAMAFSYVSPSFLEVLGYNPNELVGQSCYDIIHADDVPRLRDLERSLMRGEDVRHVLFRACRKSGSTLWLEAHVRPVRDRSTGQIRRFVSATRDVSERIALEEQLRHAVHERETVLRETHHRVKNNLQLVSSLLSLSTHGAPPDFAAVARECQARIRAMALFHDRILADSFANRVDMAAYLEPLVEDAVRYFSAAPHIEVVTRLEPLRFEGPAAVTCGLIVNELVVNSTKHAFAGAGGGRIVVGLSRTVRGRDSRIAVDVRDNGIGMPPATKRHAGLGLELVRHLAAQLGGRVVERRARGAWHRVLLPGALAG